MSRPAFLHIDTHALIHNVKRIRQFAPHQKIIAMVKANAYGCGVATVLPVLKPYVDAFGVTCMDEAIVVRKICNDCRCILFQGAYSADELTPIAQLNLECVIHQPKQLQWLLETPLKAPLKVWVKINTGMHRLGFDVREVKNVMQALRACPWVQPEINLLTHLACADTPGNPNNQKQISLFHNIASAYPDCLLSIANSAAIIALPEAHADIIRPGILLYGVSPFEDKKAVDLGLKPVITFASVITTIHDYEAHAAIGYGGTWQSDKPVRIGVVPVGYGDGYPRHIRPGTPVWINGNKRPIVGRVSMDMLTVDLTGSEVKLGDSVELWGANLPIEEIACSAGTIAYELLCQVTPRVIRN